MKHTVLIILMVFGLGCAVSGNVSAKPQPYRCGFGTQTPVEASVAEQLTATLKKLPQEGAHLHKIELIKGIRAMDGEIAGPGEIKILVDFDWQSLPAHPEQRDALDDAAAHIIRAVFTGHPAITKLRVIIKIPDSKNNYRSAAKVFTFTRATWELSQHDPSYGANRPNSSARLLALGDYVVLTPQGWQRGY